MKIKGRHLLVLIGMCGMLGASVGLGTNVAGLFFSPVAEDFGIMKGSVSLTLTVSNLVFAFSGLLAAKILNENSFKPILVIGTALMAGSTALMAMASNVMMLYVLNAVKGFAGGMLGFVLATTVINHWFYDFNGLATSIAMGTSGLVGALFSPIISSFIQSSGWRTGYLMAGAMMAVLCLPAILFVPCINPRSKGLSSLGSPIIKEVSEGGEKAAVQAEKPDGFIMMLVMLFAVVAGASTALPQHFPGLAESYALVPAVGASMLSVCMITNTASKVVMGVLIDRIGAKLSSLLYVGCVFAAVILFLVLRVSSVMVVSAGMFGLSYALGTVAIAMLTKELFGLENYGAVYPKVSLVCTVANALLSSVVGYLYDFTGGYTVTLILYAVLLACAFAAVIIAYGRKKA